MRFGLLGTLQVADGDVAVEVSAPRQRAMLALLLVHGNEVVSTDRILDALWGDDQPESGVKTLRYHVSMLRRVLGDGARLVTRAPGYILEVGRGAFDVYEFEDLAGEGRARLEDDPVAAGVSLREALTLWRGPPLDGFAYEEFAAAEARRLSAMHRGAVADRIEADLAIGRGAELVGELEDLAVAHPFDERFSGQLMTALYRAGRQADALRAYQNTRSILGEELGIEPSPGLQRLEEQILLQSPHLDPVDRRQVDEIGEAVMSATTRAVAFPAFLKRGTPETLVGREDELAHLNASYASVEFGARFVAVIGESGIGKTALTATWCRRVADDDGATVVAGRCSPDAAMPYQPFIEIARSVLRARPELLPTLGPAAGNVARLIPGIDLPADLAPPIRADTDTTRYLMAEAFAALLRSAEGDPPTVAVLDDLHWADDHSIAVLAHLARYPDDLPLLFIGTYRDTDLTRIHPLSALLSDMRREGRLDRVPLSRLTGDEVGEMIRALFGTDPSDRVVASISDETRGNPFFVEEITAHLHDEGAIDEQGHWIAEVPIADYGIPEGVRDVVGRRLDRLGTDVNAALEVAAVIGPLFSIEVAGTIAGLDDQQLDQVVEGAVAAGVVIEGDDPDEFGFGHDLIRQTLYDGLSVRRRIRLHRAVGEVFEQRGEPPAIVLPHWLNANETARALPAALNAADAAERASAGTDVIGHLATALDLWDEIDVPGTVAGTSRTELVIRLARTDDAFGDDDDLGGRLTLIMDELRSGRADDDRTRGVLHTLLSRQLAVAGRPGEAMDADLEALRLVPGEPPSADRANALAGYASRLMMGSRSSEAIDVGTETLAMASTVGADDALARALTVLATAHGMLGHLEESDRYFEELRDVAERTGQLRARLVAYGNQGVLLQANGHPDRALRLLEEGASVAVASGARRWEAVARGNAANVLFDLARWDESADQIAAVPRQGQIDIRELNLIHNALALAVERGDHGAAAREWGHIVDVDVVSLDPQFSGPISAARVSELRWQGRFVEAYDVASEALATLVDPDTWMYTARLTAHAIELVADATVAGVAGPSWLDSARMWHDRFSRDNPPAPFSDELHATATADLARARGTDDPDLWRAAIAAWSDQAYFGAKARWRLAQALADDDPTDLGIATTLDEAAETAERLKARPLLEAVRETRSSTRSAS